MHFFGWVIVIAALIILGVVLQRRWNTQQKEQNAAEAAADAPEAETGGATQWTDALRKRLQDLRNGFGNQNGEDSAVQFQDWATSAFASDPEIQSWLASLTEMQIAALKEHLAEFCRDMGFELEWLLAQELDHHPELMRGLTRIVLLYSRASYQAVALQGEVELFRVYHNYMRNPQSTVNRELGEHLFGKLVEQGLSDVAISAHLAAPARQRQRQIQDTIQRAAADQPQILYTALRTVLIERTMPEAIAESVATNGTTKAAATAAAD